MFLPIVIIFCIASVHCEPLGTNSSETIERGLPSAGGEGWQEPDLPSKGCKGPQLLESCDQATECGVFSMVIGGIVRKVYCEVIGNMTFIVIQRRDDFGDREDYFYRGWIDYKYGFGDPLRQFWIGNEALSILTEYPQELHIDLEDFDGVKVKIIAYNVSISNEEKGYVFSMSKVSPMPLGESFLYQNGQKFSTNDKDQDLSVKLNCANDHKGGWWFKDCQFVHLNGLYLRGKHHQYGQGVIFYSFKGFYYSLKSSVMKFRVDKAK